MLECTTIFPYIVLLQGHCLFLPKVLVTALLDTIRNSVLNVVLLLLLMMFLFAIMGYYFFGCWEGSDKEHWGDLGSAMLTLFSYVTVSILLPPSFRLGLVTLLLMGGGGFMDQWVV